MENRRELTFLQMNDLHGYIDLHTEMFTEQNKEVYRSAGGVARIATLFENIRNERPNQVIALDNGDTFHGTYPAVQSEGEAIVPMVNALKFDAMTAHWEFAYGPEHFEKLVTQLDYPMIAANIYNEKTNERMFPTHTIVERNGLKIGVIGVAEHIVDKMMPAHFSEGIYFTLGNEELPPIIKQLREEEQVDLVTVLSHFGLPQEVKLAKEVDGIDILLSGHTHNRMTEPVVVNDTIIFQSGCHGAYIGRLDIKIVNGKIGDFSHELIEVAESITPSPYIQGLVDEAWYTNQGNLSKVIGYTDVALHRYAQLEATMDNLLLDALIEASGAQVAFSNGWRYGAPVPPGEITMNDLWNIIPTNPPVSTTDITGAEILEMMETNLDNVFAANPYHQMGGYVKRFRGLTFYIKLENPTGMRIQQAFIGDIPLDSNKTYQAAFVTVQGIPSKYGTNRTNLSLHAVDALQQYVEKHQTVSPILTNAIRVV